MKPILHRLAADLLTSSPARFVALALDVLVFAAQHFATRHGRHSRARGHQLER